MYSSAQSPVLIFIISIWNWEAFLEAVLFLPWKKKKKIKRQEKMKYLKALHPTEYLQLQ